MIQLGLGEPCRGSCQVIRALIPGYNFRLYNTILCYMIVYYTIIYNTILCYMIYKLKLTTLLEPLRLMLCCKFLHRACGDAYASTRTCAQSTPHKPVSRNPTCLVDGPHLMYIGTYTVMCIYICICTHMCIYMHTRMCRYMSLHIVYIYIYANVLCIYMYICVYIHICIICIHIYMCIGIYSYVYIKMYLAQSKAGPPSRELPPTLK